MGRLRPTATMCGILVAFAVSGAPAAAKLSVSADQLEAETLAQLILSDARRGGPPATRLVRTRTQCCELRATDVFYRAKLAPEEPPRPPEPFPNPMLAPPPREGAYHLRLRETIHGRPLEISIHEYGTEVGYVLGTEPDTRASALSYHFSMRWHRASGTEKAGWGTSIEYSYRSFGKARSRELTRFERRQAIAVAKKAAQLAPVTGEPSDF